MKKTYFLLLFLCFLSPINSISATESALEGIIGGVTSDDSHYLDINNLVIESDLVFSGVVSSVEYKKSASGMVYTFVTYNIRDVIYGDYDSPVISVRFDGGVDLERDILARVSHNPLFDKGESDIIFLKDNGESVCPIVNCSEGRLRIYQDRVYSDSGHELIKIKNDFYLLGDVVDVDEFFEHSFSKSFKMKKDRKKAFRLKKRTRTSAVKYKRIKKSIDSLVSKNINGNKMKSRNRNSKRRVNVSIKDIIKSRPLGKKDSRFPDFFEKNKI